jgi:hypothetical protein
MTKITPSQLHYANRKKKIPAANQVSKLNILKKFRVVFYG